PRPWRPSKLRFEVEATRSPGAAMSGFIPRHIEQPAARQSKPAALNTWSRPSASAWAFTCALPGTTIAWTSGLTRLPSTMRPAALDRHVADGHPALHREALDRRAGVLDDVADRAVDAHLPDRAEDEVLGGHAEAELALVADAHRLRLALDEALGGEDVLDLAG